VWTAEAWGQDAVTPLAFLATLGPSSLEYAGAAADGWLGISFTPEHADAHLEHLRRGAEGAGRQFADVDIQVGGTVAFGDDREALVAPLCPAMAFTLGAMGSPKTNFYNDAYRQGGWEEVAAAAQQLWVAGKRDEAAAREPAEMIEQANLLGDEAGVRAGLRADRDAGVTTLRVPPAGSTMAARLDALGRVMETVREL